MYPSDDNGAVLSSMQKAGIDLSQSVEIDFTNVAPNESSARAFGTQAALLGFAIEVIAPDAEALAGGDNEWDVICTRAMVPTHEDITRFEAQLDELAKQFHCQQDGWGFTP